MSISKRQNCGRWISTLTCLLFAALFSGQALAVTFKIATLAPNGSVWMKELRAAADEIKKSTDGRVKLRFYPGGVMGDTATVLRKMQVGQLNGTMTTLGELSFLASDSLIYNLPFLFRSEDEFETIREIVDPPLTEALAKKNLVLAGTINAGFVYLFSLHPASTAEELAQKGRVWIPQGDLISQKTLEAAGISAVPLPISEVYTSLQTGLVDTVITTPAAGIALQWHSRVRYMIDMPLALGAGGMVYDQRSMKKLSDEDRASVMRITSEAMQRMGDATRLENENARKALTDAGVEVIPAADGNRTYWEDLAQRVRQGLISEKELTLPTLPMVEERLNQLRTQTAENAAH